MNSIRLFGVASFAAACMFISCASTPTAAPTKYAVSVTQAEGAEVTVEPVLARKGFDKFIVTVKNTGDSALQINWAKSTVQHGDEPQLVFLDGQDVLTADVGSISTTVAAQKAFSTPLYSVEQIISTIGSTSSDSDDDVVTDTAITDIMLEPLRAENVTISLVLVRGKESQTVTATIAPETATTPATAEKPAATEASAPTADVAPVADTASAEPAPATTEPTTEATDATATPAETAE